MFLFSLISTPYSVLSFYNWFTLHITFFSILIALESALVVCSMVLLLVYDLLWFQLILLSFSWSFLLANVYERIYNSERSALRCFCSVFTVILYLLIPILNGFGLAHALTGSPSGDICINTRSGSEAKSCALFAKNIDFTIAHLAYVGSLLSFIWVPIGAVIIGRMAWRIQT
jgi:hypothetical protein